MFDIAGHLASIIICLFPVICRKLLQIDDVKTIVKLTAIGK